MATFDEWARNAGAALLYAPAKYSDPLQNIGVASSPIPTLTNGAGLVPGLVRGYAAMGLDGVNDYLESGWKARTNLHKAPSGEGASSWSTPSTTAIAGAGGAGKVSGLQPIRLTRQTSAGGGVTGWSPGIVVTPGMTITVSGYKNATSTPDGKLRVAIDWKKSGVTLSSVPAVFENAEGRAILTATAPAEANEATVVFEATGTFAIGSTFDFEAVLVEEAAAIGSYFPTAAQLATTEAIWTGTAFKSTSQLGVFLNGTTRGFFGVAKRSTSETADVLFGSSGTGETTVVLRAVAGNNNVLFSVNGSRIRVEWANALPLASTFTWALNFNETTNIVELFINGASLGTKELAQPYNAAAGSLQIGATGNGSNPWIGSLLPFAVFTRALSAEEVAAAHELLVFDIEVPPLVAVRAEPQSGRLAFYVRRVDGTEKRLAGDEPEAEDLAQNFIFGTTVPGGYGNTSLDLTRDPRIDYGDFDLYDEFIARGPGGESAFEGYGIEIPNSGDQQMGLVATGWASSLKDNPTLQEIYVDCDLSRWGSASSARKIQSLSVQNPIGDPSVLSDPSSGLPAIALEISDSWISGWVPRVEAWYDAGPSARVNRVVIGWKATGGTPGSLSAFSLTAEDQEIAGTGANGTSSNLLSAAEGTVVYTPTAKRRYMCFDFRTTVSPGGQAGITFGVMVRGVIVVGNHGLSLTASNGLLASDVVADIIRRAAPLLTYSTGNEGSIQPSQYSIPHLIYPEPVTAEDAILQASKYDVPDWGVYDNREFFWRSPTAGRLWVARQGDSGVTLKDAGKQAEDVYTGVLVQFTDPSGKTFLVGPPGTPGCDYTDSSLQDTSETNPLVERGRTRLGKLVVSAVTTLSGAIQLGARWLQEELAVSDRGSAVVTGFVQDSAGNLEPVWKVRAGDRIRFDDADGRERRIIETSYNHEERTNSLTLDSTPHRLEALMERMQVELVAVGGAS